MPYPFLATIAFALLVLFATFIANLTVLVFTNSMWHITGVVSAILATAASYWSQHHYTSAGWFRAELSSAPALTAYQAAAEKAESMGVLFQYVAIIFLVIALVAFVMGLL